jgi:hypothetical protein
MKPALATAAREKKQKIAAGILLTGSDVLCSTGIALLIAGIIQNDTLPLYHLHIIYDSTSFVLCVNLSSIYTDNYCPSQLTLEVSESDGDSIANSAAIVCSFTPTMEYKYARYTVIYIFAILYVIYIILFGIRLRSWNLSVQGHCFDTSLTATPSSTHPGVDYAYLVVTCFYAYASLIAAFVLHKDEEHHGIGIEAGEGLSETPDFCSRRGAETQAEEATDKVVKRMMVRRDKTERYVLTIAFLQYPVHVWSIFALRAANNNVLTAGKEEQEWGFGQIFAIMTLGGNIISLCNGIGG